MSDLAKTITVPHQVKSSFSTRIARATSFVQQLDDSIKETVQIVNKHLLDENLSLRKPSPEPSLSSDHPSKSTDVHLVLNTGYVSTTHRSSLAHPSICRDCLESIDVIFSSVEQKHAWQRHFLEAKRQLCKIASLSFLCSSALVTIVEMAAGRRNVTFQRVLTLPHHRRGSQVSPSSPSLVTR